MILRRMAAEPSRLSDAATKATRASVAAARTASSVVNASSDFRRGAAQSTGAPSASTTRAPSRRLGLAATRAASTAGADPAAVHITSGQGMPAPRRQTGSSAGSTARDKGRPAAPPPSEAVAASAKPRSTSTVSRAAN